MPSLFYSLRMIHLTHLYISRSCFGVALCSSRMIISRRSIFSTSHISIKFYSFLLTFIVIGGIIHIYRSICSDYTSSDDKHQVTDAVRRENIVT